MERLPADRRAAAPAEIVSGAAEQRRNRSIPGGGQRTGEAARANAPAGDEPAIRCRCADMRVFKRGDQLPSQPREKRTSESVKTKTSNFRAALRRLGGGCGPFRRNPRVARQSQYVPGRWLAALTRSMIFSAGSRLDRQREKDLVIGIVESRERLSGFLQAPASSPLQGQITAATGA